MAQFYICFSMFFWCVHTLTLRLFLSLRGITGFFQGGVYITLYVLTTEFVGPKHRSFAGTLVWIFYTSSLMLLAGLAYGIRDWRTLSIVISVPAFPLLIFWRWVYWFLEATLPLAKWSIQIRVVGFKYISDRKLQRKLQWLQSIFYVLGQTFLGYFMQLWLFSIGMFCG